MAYSAGVDAVIDRFVEHINHSARQRIRAGDLPPPLRRGKPNFGLYYDWAIEPAPQAPWVHSVLTKVPAPLPASYRSLITRYRFPAFEKDGFVLLSNTGRRLYHEISTVVFRHKALSQPLLEKGIFQFARPASGEYDPICFDLNVRHDGECPIVRVDYESMLWNAGALVVEWLAPSFLQLVERWILNAAGLWTAEPVYRATLTTPFHTPRDEEN